MKTKIKRLEAFSTGGGGGNIIRKIAVMLEEMNLSSAVGYTVIDTNKKSLAKTVSLFPEDIKPNVRHKKLGLGNGSGCDPNSARRDIEDEKTAGELLQTIEEDAFEAAPVFGTLGKGTATGTLLPLLKILRKARVMAFGVVVKCSQEYGEVEEAQDIAAEEAIKELDESGIPYILAMNRAAYIESEKNTGAKITREDAYGIIDKEIAHSLRAFLRVLADPDQADREDIRKLIYSGGNDGRKRWRLGTVELSKDFTEKDLTKAVRQCFENQRFDFDNSRIGGTLVIREGKFAAHEVAAMNLEMRSIVNGWGDGDKREVINTHYRLIEAEYPSINENNVNITFLFSEYNGDPDLESLPEIRWADEADGEEDRTIHEELEDLNREIQKQSARTRTNIPAQPHVVTNREAKSFKDLAAFVAALNLNNEAAREILGGGPEGLEFFNRPEVMKNLDNPIFLNAMKGPLAAWYDHVVRVLLEEKLQPIDGLYGPDGSENNFANHPRVSLDEALNKKGLHEKERKTILVLKFLFQFAPLDEQDETLAKFQWAETNGSSKTRASRWLPSLSNF